VRRIRYSIAGAVALLALVPATVLAATNYHEDINGIETGYPYTTSDCAAPNSVSPFAGSARGTLDGTFQIAVCHTPLSPNAEILGGSFTLTDGATTVTGQFANGGTVTLVNQSVLGTACTQTYAVQGALLPAGSFSGQLVHYGYWTGTSCSIFFATVSGSAHLRT
jgi:hypothetical protein